MRKDAVKPPLLVGLVLAVLIIAAGLLAPVLRGSGRKTAERAQLQAVLAERELARVSLTMPRLDALANPAEMTKNEAALKAAVAAAVADPNNLLPQASREYAAEVRSAQQRAAKAGLPAPTFPALTPDTAGAQRALSEFQTLLRANDALLSTAIKEAQAARDLDGGALGVAQALGMVQYVQAAGLLSEAEALRAQQAAAEARLLDMASGWKVARGHLDHYQALEVTPILSQLRDDLDEVGKLHVEAAAELKSLTTQASEREQALARVRQALQESTKSLLVLEQQGFTAGNDAEFDAYRRHYLELAQQVRELQQQEQELRLGGRRGAQLPGEDLATAPIEGGETVVGLEELQRRVAAAQEREQRLTNAIVTLEECIKYQTESAEQAQNQAAHYQERLTTLAGQQKELVKEIEKLTDAAFNKETQALQAASTSSAAFGQSQRAAEAWMRAARELRSEKDPDRKNERLRLVTSDPYLEQVSRSAEAAALILVGRIHLQRVESLQTLLDGMHLFAAVNPDSEFNAAKYQEQLDAARTAGIAALTKARDAYAAISEKLANQTTVWAPLAGLAAANHLLARIDPAQAAAYDSKALEAIQKAVEKREQSPYVQPFVVFRDYLRGAARPGAEPEEPKEPKKEEEKGGFFLDEEK